MRTDRVCKEAPINVRIYTKKLKTEKAILRQTTEDTEDTENFYYKIGVFSVFGGLKLMFPHLTMASR